MNPYRTPAELDEGEPAVETPQAIIFDTIVRLNKIEYSEALRVIRALAAYMGFGTDTNDGRVVEPETIIGTDEEEEDDDE